VFKDFVTKQKKTLTLGLIGLLVVGVAASSAYLSSRNSTDPRGDAADIADVTLNVQAGTVVSKFTNDMIGLAYYDAPPYTDANYVNAMKEIKPGIIRFAMGLGANEVGWERTAGSNYRDKKYSWLYTMSEMDQLNTFADSIGAEVMIQVNISINDPAMWADMVRYINIEKGYKFKYWELGNEIDLETIQKNWKGMTPQEYANRVVAYQKAMSAVDPSIIVVPGCPAFPGVTNPYNPWNDGDTQLSQYLTETTKALKAAGLTPQSMSYHWYQNSGDIDGMKRYTWAGLAENSWRNSYSRKNADLMTKRIRNEALTGISGTTVGLTEMNVDGENFGSQGNRNHLGALWATDVIGRLAYNGTDYMTWWNGYKNAGYGMISGSSGDPVGSSFYTFLLYNKFFGDQMVQTSTNEIEKTTIWASRDSADPGKLKVIITNFSGAPTKAAINIGGFTPKSAQVYEVLPDAPVSGTSINQGVYSKINGKKLGLSTISQDVQSIPAKVETISGSSFTREFPAYSITSMVLSGDAVAVTTAPTSTATATPTPTVTAAPTNSPTPTTTVATTATATPTPTITTTTAPANSTATPTPTVTPTTVPGTTTTPTSTPTPTNTPTPSPTPYPTTTSVPGGTTSTATPTATSAPTNSSGGGSVSTATPTNINSQPTLPQTGVEESMPWFMAGGLLVLMTGVLIKRLERLKEE
jgi:LPXTG-motif cell wall-anchored protein